MAFESLLVSAAFNSLFLGLIKGWYPDFLLEKAVSSILGLPRF
jgi:hypothetical protein